MTAETTVRGIIEAAAVGREALTPDEAKRICDAYDIRSADQAVAGSAAEAVAIAETIGYPVAAKIVSPDIAHKTDAGGVVLDIADATALANAYGQVVANARAFDADAAIDGVLIQRQLERTQDTQEVIVGAVTDPAFGKLVAFGLGGVFVEALRDITFRLAPATVEEASSMLDEIAGAEILKGVRGAAAVRSNRAGNADRQCESPGSRFSGDRGTGPESRVRER